MIQYPYSNFSSANNYNKGGHKMTDSEKLDLILSKLNNLESDMQELKRRTTSVESHIENVTDRNVQLIAENFNELPQKRNQANTVADKNLAYEVKVNYLANEVEKLNKRLQSLKTG